MPCAECWMPAAECCVAPAANIRHILPCGGTPVAPAADFGHNPSSGGNTAPRRNRRIKPKRKSTHKTPAKPCAPAAKFIPKISCEGTQKAARCAEHRTAFNPPTALRQTGPIFLTTLILLFDSIVAAALETEHSVAD